MSQVHLILFLTVVSFTVNGQTDSVKTAPTMFDLIGTWRNAAYAFESIQIKSTKPPSIYDSRIDLPDPDAGAEPPGKYFTIIADGRFFDTRYYDAKWQLVGDHLVISSPVGLPVHATIFREDSTGVYRIVLNGAIYRKTNLKNHGIIRR